MKKWNTPEVSELNINETASGSWAIETEAQAISVGAQPDSLWLFVTS